MTATFYESGRWPSVRDVLHMTEINGIRMSIASRRTDAGNASRVQVIGGEFMVAA